MATDTEVSQADITAKRERWEEVAAEVIATFTKGPARLKRLAQCVPVEGDPLDTVRWLRRILDDVGVRWDAPHPLDFRAALLRDQASQQQRFIEDVARELLRAVYIPLADLIDAGHRDPSRPVVAKIDFRTPLMGFNPPTELPFDVAIPKGGMFAGLWRGLPADHVARQSIVEKDCFQHNDAGWLILGPVERQSARAFWDLDMVLALTKAWRAGQQETLAAERRLVAEKNRAEFGPNWDGSEPSFVSAEAEAAFRARAQSRELEELRQRVKQLEAADKAER